MVPFEQWDHGGPIAVKTTVVHDHVMSREDPQFKLRMPADLRIRAEDAAKASGRSLNAELVARLETSLLDSPSDKLIPAERAKELSLIARSAFPAEIRRRILASINKAISLGHSYVNVDLKDLALDGAMSDEEIDAITYDITHELTNAGYKVEWDGCAWVWISF